MEVVDVKAEGVILKGQIEVKARVTPTELAEVFSWWDSDAHAEFFSALGNAWDTYIEGKQLQHVRDSRKLTQKGRDIMSLISGDNP